ncbi:MAG: biopolymer transporter ExbD [Bdellovibrionota bacterium]
MSGMYKKFLKQEERPFTLNITSMTDMFTILLVFLLQSFSATQINLEIPPEMNTPSANLPIDVDGRSTLFVRQNDVLWQKKSLLTREQLRSPQQRTVASESLKQWVAENPGQKIQLMADKGTSYAEIKMVLEMAATAQIGEIRLVTLKGVKDPAP